MVKHLRTGAKLFCVMSLSIVFMQDVWGNIGGLVRVNHVESVGDLE